MDFFSNVQFNFKFNIKERDFGFCYEKLFQFLVLYRLEFILETHLTTSKIIMTTNNGTANREMRQWTYQEIRLLIDQRKNRNIEYYRIIGRSRLAYWDSIARRINRVTGSNFNGNQCKRKFKNLVATYNVSKII